MQRGIQMDPWFDVSGIPSRVLFQTNYYSEAVGVLPPIQRFATILLSTFGSDPVRPWLGTNFNQLPRMNIVNKEELHSFVSTEVDKAKVQFFTLQDEETDVLTQDDIISTIDLVGVEVLEGSRVVVNILFKPLTTEAINVALTA